MRIKYFLHSKILLSFQIHRVPCYWLWISWWTAECFYRNRSRRHVYEVCQVSTRIFL